MSGAGLTALRFHDLEHTGNTLAASTGASTKELMSRMGHASPRARAHIPARHFGARPRSADALTRLAEPTKRSPAETARRKSIRTAMFDQCSIGPFVAFEIPSEGQKCWSRWWRRADSNRRPPACKAGALPTELRPRGLGLARSLATTLARRRQRTSSPPRHDLYQHPGSGLEASDLCYLSGKSLDVAASLRVAVAWRLCSLCGPRCRHLAFALTCGVLHLRSDASA